MYAETLVDFEKQLNSMAPTDHNTMTSQIQPITAEIYQSVCYRVTSITFREPPRNFVMWVRSTGHTVQSKMSSERGDGRAKLNMEHGFMQSIIKNQVDRDEYDKEQKLFKVQNKISGPSRRERPRRADQQVYVPPHLRGKATPETEPETSLSAGEFQILGSVVFLWFIIHVNEFSYGGKHES